MSLVETRWVIVAGAAALAIAMPTVLLRGDGIEVPSAAPAPPTELGELQTASLSYALAAPPFDPDRTPGGDAAAADAASAAPPPPAQLPRLVGLISGARGRSVALVRTANGETVTIAPGEEADGWRLVSVGRDQAVFDLAGNRQTATLDFSNKVSAPATAAPPQPQPPPSNVGPPLGPSGATTQ